MEQTNYPTFIFNLKVNREELIKFAFSLALLEYNIDRDKKIEFSNRELDVLTLLYNRGGIDNSEGMDKFVLECFEKGFIRSNSTQSIRNIFTKARAIGFIKRRTVNNWKIAILPNTDSQIIIKSLLTNVE